MPPRDAFLSMQGVRYQYPDTSEGVAGIDLQVPAGAFHCLLGRSGCGKSTLLKLAAGLLAPTGGEARIGGRAVDGPDTSTSFVFQSPTLLDWLTVLDNVLLPMSLRTRPGADDRARAESLLAQLGMAALGARYPWQLSGGQQSRVAIARALLTGPRLLLMDEPFAALDALTREALQDTLLAACQAQGISVLFVTHDIAEAVYLADRVSVMAQGRLYADLPIALPRPRAPDLRHGADFNAYCARLRAHMADLA